MKTLSRNFCKSQKNYCFAIKDELNTDVRCDFYLPGNLYRIEIITDGPRDAEAEISEVPSGKVSNLQPTNPSPTLMLALSHQFG